MRKAKADCCSMTFVTGITTYHCTIPNGIPHAEHESWNFFGCWSQDPTSGGTYPAGSAKMQQIWKNQQYVPPAPAPTYKKPEKPKLDMSDWADDWDCLPDA